MGWQLIFTSAPRTLSAGQSGYGTVARSQDLRDALVQRLEQLSYYSLTALPGHSAAPPVVCAYRVLDLRGTKYHILTRIQDAGLDFTSRTNHLAHHLVFAPAELPALASPPLIFQHWGGWRTDWREEPRWLEHGDWADWAQVPRAVPVRAPTWQRVTGDAGRAAALLERPLINGCFVVGEPGGAAQLLALFAESLQLLDPVGQAPAKLWQHPFTTCLQAEDNPLDFCWRGCLPGTPACVAAQRSSPALVIVPANVRPPANALAQLAREGPPSALPKPIGAVPQAVVPEPAPRGKLTLRSAAPGAPAGAVGPTGPDAAEPPAEPPRALTLDFTSPRVLWPTLGLCALLALLGYLRWSRALPRPENESETAALPTKTNAIPLPPPRSGDLVIADPGTVTSGAPAAPPGPTPPPAVAPPSAAAVRQLREQFDTLETHTLLALGQRDQATAIPAGSELRTLLHLLFRQEPPLSIEEVRCSIESDSYVLGEPRTESVKLKLVSTGVKRLIALNAQGQELFTLDASDWYKDPQKWPTLQAGAPTAEVLKIWLRAVSGHTNSAPFRLVLALGAAPPLRLDKSLLLAERGGFEAALTEELGRRWRALGRQGVAGVQLRPWTATNVPGDLLEKLGPNLTPAPGEELNFTQLRKTIQNQLTGQQAQKSGLDQEIARLKDRIQVDSTNERALGQQFGLRKDWRSLATFARVERKEMDRQLFLVYLQRVAAHARLGPEAPVLVAAPAAEAEAALVQLHAALLKSGYTNELAGIPADYFVKRWQELGLVDQRRAAERRRQFVAGEVTRLQVLLHAVPSSLAGTPRVELRLRPTNGPPIEFIRFTDSP
jgi:hypothetical protein